VNEVTEDCISNASNESDQTTVNRHTNRVSQLALQLASSIQSVSADTIINLYNACNHHSVCIQCLLLLLSNV